MKDFLLAVGSLFLFSYCIAASASESGSLFVEIRSGDLDSVKHLLAQRANVNARDDTGTTPLMHAIAYANMPMVTLLLNGGADVNARNDAGATALMWSVSNHGKTRLLLGNRSHPGAVKQVFP